MAALPIRWSAEAVQDLEEIHAYINRHSPRYASVTIGRLPDAVERAAAFPEAGRMVPELGDRAGREVIHGAYRVVYELGDGALTVLTVFRGSRQFPLDR